MARIAMSGWETGHPFSEDPIATGAAFTGSGMSIDATIFRSGSRSLKASAVSGVSGSHGLGGVGSGRRARVYVRVTARPSTTARILIGSSTSSIRLNPNGTLGFYAIDLLATSTTALTDTSRWYRLEWYSGAPVGTPTFYVDGELEYSTVGSAFPSMNGIFGPNDTVADTYTAYFDDFVSDDSAFPGEGRVALLLPTSQNSVTASTWQKPGGATTNMHTSVDNVPPVGVANSTNVAQAENQIRNAVSNATADVRFDMQTYADAGLVTGDTVNATQAFAIVGLATTATTKTGSLEVVSNPAVAEVNFGAYGTGAAVGTFPTGWQRRSHTIAQNPSVTLNTAPVVELGQRTANTTVAQCCFVGMYVDYTPAAAPPPGAAQGPAYIGAGYYG